MSLQSERVIVWRQHTKHKIVLAMGGCCQICGYDKTDAALELHHVDPSQKEFTFGRIRANPKSILKIRDELLKCILLCSNCHKEVHAGATKLPEKYTTLDEHVLLAKKRTCKVCKSRFLDVYTSRFCSKVCAGRHNATRNIENGVVD